MSSGEATNQQALKMFGGRPRILVIMIESQCNSENQVYISKQKNCIIIIIIIMSTWKQWELRKSLSLSDISLIFSVWKRKSVISYCIPCIHPGPPMPTPLTHTWVMQGRPCRKIRRHSNKTTSSILFRRTLGPNLSMMQVTRSSKWANYRHDKTKIFQEKQIDCDIFLSTELRGG